MKELFSTLKEAPLNNHCPKCFSTDGLNLTFKQRHLRSSWADRRTEDVTALLYCKNCDQQIYPVDWDEDIERVYNYQRKAAPPKPAYYKPRRNFYIAIGLCVVAIGCVVAYTIIV